MHGDGLYKKNNRIVVSLLFSFLLESMNKAVAHFYCYHIPFSIVEKGADLSVPFLLLSAVYDFSYFLFQRNLYLFSKGAGNLRQKVQ